MTSGGGNDGESFIDEVEFEDMLSVRLKKIGDLISEMAPKMVANMGGVRFSEIRILAYLVRRPSASILEISQDLLVDKAWVSRLVGFLHARGFITREKQRDGHTVLVSVTGAGRDAYATIMADLRRHQPVFLQGVDHDSAAAVCERLEANLRQLRKAFGPARRTHK